MSAPIRQKQRKVTGSTRPQGVARCAGSVDEGDGPTRRKPREVTLAPEVADYLDEIVAQAPPMSAHARAQLAALLGRSVRRAA